MALREIENAPSEHPEVDEPAAHPPAATPTKSGEGRVASFEEWATLHTHRHPFDVLFDFGASGLTLWEQSTFLSKRSPYWSKRLIKTSTASEDSDMDEEAFPGTYEPKVEDEDTDKQSQVEDEAVQQGDPPASKGPRSHLATEVPDAKPSVAAHQTIDEAMDEDSNACDSIEFVSDVINGCALDLFKIPAPADQYHAHRATLFWLRTGSITFGGLMSDCPEYIAINPITPPSTASIGAICPKSIYRLASSFHLVELQQLAFESIESQLISRNVAFELFGALSNESDEIHRLYLELAVKKWAKVKATKGMAQVKKLFGEGSLPNASKTFMELSLAL